MIQMNCTTLPYQKPLGTRIISLDAHKSVMEQINMPKHGEAWCLRHIYFLKLFEFLYVIRKQNTKLSLLHLIYPSPFWNLFDYKVPHPPLESQKAQ